MNQSAPIIVKVVVDRPLNDAFDYSWNSASLGANPEIGMLVEVPFGRTNLVGLIIEVSSYTQIIQTKLKDVRQRAPVNPPDSRLMQLGYLAS